MINRDYTNQLRRELEAGKSRRGVPLDGATRHEHLAKLRHRASTLAPRFRRAEEARLAELERAIAAHVTSEANRVISEVSSAVADTMAPLLARSEGRVPARRPGQSAAERKLELDQALASVPALRAERQRCAEEERAAKNAARDAAKRPRHQ